MAAMINRTNAVWNSLKEAGLVEGEAPAAEELKSPWYLKVLTAFSGWFAAMFLFPFIALAFDTLLDNNPARLITGSVMIVIAYQMFQALKSLFFEHLTLSVSLAGQVLITWALLDFGNWNSASSWIAVTLFQALLAVVMPNYIHRVFSSFSTAIALSVSLFYFGTLYLFSSITLFLAAWLWLNEFKFPSHIRKMHAISYGLVLALIPIKGTLLFAQPRSFLSSSARASEQLLQPWMGELLAGGVILYIVWQLLQRYSGETSTRFTLSVLFSTLLICMASIQAPGITIGMAILLLGFSTSNPILKGLGIASLLFYLSSYYYLLDITLMAKAQTLFITGLVLLAIHGFMLRFKPESAETDHE
jgi:hypothetical protein